MKVLHVLDHSAPHYDGYAFRSLEIIRFQRALGIQTAHVTSAKHDAGDAETETFDDLLYYRTRAGNGPLSRLPLLDQWDVVATLERRLRGILDVERPDVVHAHSPSLNGIAAIRAARRVGLPVVYEIRAFWEDAAVDKGACREGDLRYRATRGLEDWVLARAQHVVCICAGLHGDVAARGVPAERLSMVPNAVDLARFKAGPHAADAALAAELGLTPGRTLGFIGSFFRFEGLDVLVRSVRHLLAADERYRVLMVGSGVEAERLHALAESEGVAHAVKFTGRVPHAEVGRYYEAVDLFVYPRVSMRITELVTPLKPLEAMATGRNVLASDVGGHRELIRDGDTGLLFHAGDAADLARQATRLLDDPPLAERLRKQALDYVRDERDWQVNVKRYLPVYEQVLRRTGRAAA